LSSLSENATIDNQCKTFFSLLYTQCIAYGDIISRAFKTAKITVLCALTRGAAVRPIARNLSQGGYA